MATSKNARTDFEYNCTLHDFTAMTDSGDHTTFTLSGVPVWSGDSGYEPEVLVNGIVTGFNVLSPHADANKVTVAGITANSGGVEYEVSATTATVVRPASDVAKVCSIVMNDAGSIEVVEGTDGSTTSFSETRGAAGGPPEIEVDDVEVGQIRMTSSAAAVILASEIKQDIGTHVERADFPAMLTPNNIGDGLDAIIPAKKNAYVAFSSAFPAIHTSGAYKKVYIKCYAPTFIEAERTLDFVPAENSHSVSSEAYYNGTVGSVTSSLGQGSVKVLMNDNVTDLILRRKDRVTTIRHYPDRNRSAYTLTQGTIGVKRSYNTSGQNAAAITISAEKITADFSG